jgi:hypothetical protein
MEGGCIVWGLTKMIFDGGGALIYTPLTNSVLQYIFLPSP